LAIGLLGYGHRPAAMVYSVGYGKSVTHPVDLLAGRTDS